MLASTCWSLVASSRIGRSTIKDVKFDGAIEWKSVHLMLNGCPVAEFDATASDISAVHNLSEPIEINGLMLTFPDFSQVFGFFQVIGNSTSEIGGSIMMSPDWHWNDRGVRFLANPVQLRATMTLDFRPPWPWYFEYAMTSFMIASMFVCVGASRLFRLSLAARTSLCGCVLLAAIHCVATAGYLSLALHRQACLTGAYALIWASASLVLSLAPNFFGEACACLGGGSIFARVASDCTVFRDCGNLVDMPPVYEVAVTLVGMALVAVKYRRLVKVVQELAQERTAYDAVWQLMLEGEGFDAATRRLEELMRRAKGAPSRGTPLAIPIISRAYCGCPCEHGLSFARARAQR